MYRSGCFFHLSQSTWWKIRSKLDWWQTIQNDITKHFCRLLEAQIISVFVIFCRSFLNLYCVWHWKLWHFVVWHFIHGILLRGISLPDILSVPHLYRASLVNSLNSARTFFILNGISLIHLSSTRYVCTKAEPRLVITSSSFDIITVH